MGLDGLSFANTGAVKESTSADLANKTEHALHTNAETDSQQVQSLGVEQRIHAKEDEEGSKKQKRENNKKEDDLNDEFIESTNENNLDTEYDVEDIENINKDFYVKLNAKDDIIELYDSATDRLIETISGNELGELVQKLNMASGIFINKKV